MIQFILNGVIMCGWLSVIAVSFWLIYRVAGFFHFAHALAIAAAPYFFFSLLSFGVPYVVSISLALAGAGAVGMATDFFVYRLITRRGASALALMLASLGIYIVGQNVISLLWGDEPVTFPRIMRDGSVDILGGYLTYTNAMSIIVAFCVMVAIVMILNLTSLGRSARAIACDRQLAIETGVAVEQVRLLTYFLGSTIGGLGGIVITYDTSARPMMGLDALLPGVVAVVLGGDKGILGVLIASFLLSMATHLGIIYVSSLWQPSIVFGVLFLFLLSRAIILQRGIAPQKARG